MTIQEFTKIKNYIDQMQREYDKNIGIFEHLKSELKESTLKDYSEECNKEEVQLKKEEENFKNKLQEFENKYGKIL